MTLEKARQIVERPPTLVSQRRRAGCRRLPGRRRRPRPRHPQAGSEPTRGPPRSNRACGREMSSFPRFSSLLSTAAFLGLSTADTRGGMLLARALQGVRLGPRPPPARCQQRHPPLLAFPNVLGHSAEPLGSVADCPGRPYVLPLLLGDPRRSLGTPVGKRGTVIVSPREAGMCMRNESSRWA